MENSIIGMLKDFLLICVYPIIAFFGKKLINRAEAIEKTQQDHSVRLSVHEAKVENIEDDIREIKKSIDELPQRIKSDIKDIIKNG